MATTTRAFLIGVGTTLTVLTAGFGGGLLFAKNVMEPAPAAKIRSAADRLPAVRVILPASAEAAKAPEAVTAGITEPSQPAAAPQPVAEQPQVPTQTTQQAAEEDKRAERIARRKAEAEERERRKRVAERKARRDAARLARRLQQQEQDPQRRESSILAFGEEQSRGPGLFGN